MDLIGPVKKISLCLYTRGGNTLTAWSLINLIRQYCDELEIIVPSKCQSSGTIMCLGANKIIMTKQATLGPIDPSLNTPLNPPIEGAPSSARYPISVEAIKGYIEFAKKEFGLEPGNGLQDVLLSLGEKVHPIVLGQVYRSMSQIQMLARKLIVNQMSDESEIEHVISFLCSGSGSHDYTINRREARDELKLAIEKPSQKFYELIKLLYDDIQAELKLTEKFDPVSLIGNMDSINYALKRALLESVKGGSDYFVSNGSLTKQQIPVGPNGHQRVNINDTRNFEGWKHDNTI